MVCYKKNATNMWSNMCFQHVKMCIPNSNTCSACSVRFGRVVFLWKLCKVPVSLRTASISWCPAVLKFPLAQKIYYLTTSDLQLSTALLSYSCCRPTVNGKSYLVQIASQYCEARGLTLKTVCNQRFGIVIQSLRMAKCKTTNMYIFLIR